MCIYETLTFACAIVFFVFTFVPGHTVTVLAKGLTMALFDWMLIALMFYTQYYTGAVKTFKGVQAASMIFAVLDTYMLIENTWTNKINPLYLSCISNIYFRYCAKFNTLYIWGGY